jgi:uncharacterized protein (TIGR02453 family)
VGRFCQASLCTLPDVSFTGWPAEAIEFFEGLEADNSKAYWTEHKEIYERCVRAPMAELLTELEPEFGEGKIFRPYRDVRFSKDKSPYKTNIAATLAGGGYIHLNARTLGAGAGIYMMSTDQVERYRQAVVEEPAGSELEETIAVLGRRGIGVASHDPLKTAPKGFAKEHPRVGLLRNKDLVAWQEWPVGAWLGTSRAKKHLITFLRAVEPLNKWLQRNVGPSASEPRDAHRR